MRVVTFKADEELVVQLQLIAINERRTVSEVIRDAIMFYLSCRKLTGRVYRKFNNIEIIGEDFKNIVVTREL
ncbi:ribbon-helix-helix protein, CopG family [Sulfurisphaera ohwakuensis]|uniref:ribbon-helix-helix protein, CopG family n=1 Tax=Sulfurisphaera ohwakuensis TaxID=69656 RepID=UPI0036F26073